MRRRAARRSLSSPDAAGVRPAAAGPRSMPISRPGPADEELRAIRVAPIPERIGRGWRSRCAIAEPGWRAGAAALCTAHHVASRAGRSRHPDSRFRHPRQLDAYANFTLNEITSGACCSSRHEPRRQIVRYPGNKYSDASPKRTPAPGPSSECAATSSTRLTLFLQRRAQREAAKPTDSREARRQRGRGVSAPPRPRDPRRAALRSRCRPGARAGRHTGAHGLSRSADPFRVADLDRRRPRRRPGAARRRGGADQPDGRPARRPGARGRRRAGDAVRPVPRRRRRRCPRRRRGRRPARPLVAAPRLRRRAARRGDRLLPR